MEIIETIPVYNNPTWLILICIVAGAVFLATLFNDKFNTITGVIMLIAFVILITGIILALTHAFIKYDHDEYIVRITDMSAVDFVKEYKLVGTYDYSDVIRIKKINGR